MHNILPLDILKFQDNNCSLYKYIMTWIDIEHLQTLTDREPYM